MKNKCTEVVDYLLRKDFVNWNGLDQDCTIKELFSLIQPQKAGPTTGILGSKAIQYEHMVCSHPDFEYSIRVWYKQEVPIRLDAFFPDINLSASDFRKSVGEPERKGNYYFGGILIQYGEWIYGGRGMTAYLNADLDKVIQISFYHPVSIKIYEEEIKTAFSSREFN